MKRVFTAAVILALIGCRRPPEVPVNQFLVHLDAPWVTPPEAAGRKVRTAPATVVSFRNEGEYLEVHCQLIEQPDTTLYVSSDHHHIAVVGHWTLQKDSTISVVREKVARPGSAKVLCKPITFRISGKSAVGDAIGRGEGSYSPVTGFELPDIDIYMSEARQSPVTCP
ncbi:MAG TPA: hypothetical protein VII12_17565 [Thermoanaerobaculia bacterium]